ncbi:MAG: imelysin family protein [Planctomycetota bacterium]|jgi:putative iron-regulated protein
MAVSALFALPLLVQFDTPAVEVTASDVVEHYVLQAHARYSDSLAAAQELNKTVQAFLRKPTPEGQTAAKRAWLRAHSVYSHTEVFRFGNPNVDAWEGKVNAWPMDEGLIDYVADGYVFHEGNPFATYNIIATGSLQIDEELISAMAEGTDPKAAYELRMSEVESNVTTGYHAIEFLLWGQDLDGGATHDNGGQRPYTDFVLGEEGTGGNNKRRREYMQAAVGLLQYDLRFAIRDWKPEGKLYSKTFSALPVAERLDRMLIGMGSLSFAELASERIRVALLTGDQEEEQSCFSDTTHHAILHNTLGIESLYQGRHTRIDGTLVEGPSLAELVRSLDPRLDARVTEAFAKTREVAQAIADAGDAGRPFDTTIADFEANEGRAQLEQLIECLRIQAECLEAVRARVPELALVGAQE